MQLFLRKNATIYLLDTYYKMHNYTCPNKARVPFVQVECCIHRHAPYRLNVYLSRTLPCFSGNLGRPPDSQQPPRIRLAPFILGHTWQPLRRRRAPSHRDRRCAACQICRAADSRSPLLTSPVSSCHGANRAHVGAVSPYRVRSSCLSTRRHTRYLNDFYCLADGRRPATDPSSEQQQVPSL